MAESPEYYFRVNTIGSFGQELRRLRLDAGLTQAELAQEAGVSRRWISMCERGHAGAELERVMRVCRALGLGLRFAPAPHVDD